MCGQSRSRTVYCGCLLGPKEEGSGGPLRSSGTETVFTEVPEEDYGGKLRPSRLILTESRTDLVWENVPVTDMGPSSTKKRSEKDVVLSRQTLFKFTSLHFSPSGPKLSTRVL